MFQPRDFPRAERLRTLTLLSCPGIKLLLYCLVEDAVLALAFGGRRVALSLDKCEEVPIIFRQGLLSLKMPDFLDVLPELPPLCLRDLGRMQEKRGLGAHDAEFRTEVA